MPISGRTSQSIPLDGYTTVFQAEVDAILVCGLDLLSDPRRGSRTVIRNNRTSIKAIEAEMRSMECKSTLMALSRGGRVFLAWVPRHTSVPGNIKADRLAGLETKKPLLWPEPVVGISYSRAIFSIKSMTKKLSATLDNSSRHETGKESNIWSVP